jgi:hypothetical protein
MLQEWSDMVDVWINEQTHVPRLLQENLTSPVHVGCGTVGDRSFRQRFE